MSRSEVDICNMALREISVEPIASLTESSQPARDCNLFYEAARDDTLRAFYWNFAQKRLTLTAHEVPDEFDDYLYAYDYPGDCIKIKSLRAPGGSDEEIFEIFTTSLDERIILTNVEEAILEYTARVTNPARYDETFVEALVLKLAEKLAVPLRQNPGLKSVMFQQFSLKILEADKNNRQERKKPQKDNFAWFKARQGITNASGY